MCQLTHHSEFSVITLTHRTHISLNFSHAHLALSRVRCVVEVVQRALDATCCEPRTVTFACRDARVAPARARAHTVEV